MARGPLIKQVSSIHVMAWVETTAEFAAPSTECEDRRERSEQNHHGTMFVLRTVFLMVPRATGLASFELLLCAVKLSVNHCLVYLERSSTLARSSLAAPGRHGRWESWMDSGKS